jgi:amino-acid N-acetyltransferase
VTVDKALFPEKIWSDCQACPKRDRCDEEAVLREVRADAREA